MEKTRSFLTWILQKRSRVILSILILLLISVFFFTRGNGSEEPQIQTAEVKRGTIISSVSASGQILTSNIAHVTSKASGIVTKVYVSDGDEIVKGQTIAEIELDSEGVQNQASAYASYVIAINSLENAENNFRSAKATLDRVYDDIQGHDEDESIEIRETRTSAEVVHDNAYNAIETARAHLNSAWLKYSETRTVISAPASGTINSVTIAEGLTLGATEGAGGSRSSQRFASIMSMGIPLASFNISEIDISLIEVGQKATITIDSIPDKTFTGRVVSVDRVGTTTSAVTNYPVIIKLDTSSDEVLPNMSASASIVIERKSDVLIVAIGAVQNQGEQSTVRVLRDNVEQSVPVEIGISSDTEVEIISGLSEGDEVVTGTLPSGQSSQGGSPFGGFGGFGGARRLSR